MYLGQIVEVGPAERILEAPGHPYTRALVAAVSEPDPRLRREHRLLVPGEIPSPKNPPAVAASIRAAPSSRTAAGSEVPLLEEAAPGVLRARATSGGRFRSRAIRGGSPGYRGHAVAMAPVGGHGHAGSGGDKIRPRVVLAGAWTAQAAVALVAFGLWGLPAAGGCRGRGRAARLCAQVQASSLRVCPASLSGVNGSH